MRNALKAVTLCSLLLSAAHVHAADTMSPQAFCAGVHRKAQAVFATCEDNEHVKSFRQMFEMSLKNDSCEMYLKNVEISAKAVPACLAEINSHWNQDIANLDSRPACRAAIRGKVGVGQPCFFHLQCGTGSWCVSPLDKPDHALDKVCSPVIKAGSRCVTGAGDSCGADFFCAEGGTCVPKLAKGQTCNAGSQTCDGDMTCLRERGTDKQGKCGPLRKAGEACHRWTDCRGTCNTPNESAEDGKCASFCGSN